MVRLLRIVVAVLGVVLVVGSSALTWVDVELDIEALALLAEEAADGTLGDAVDSAIEDAVDGEIDTSELVDDAAEVIESVRDLVPDRLLDAALNGQNAYDLLGLGFLLVGLALGAAISVGVWAVRGIGWVRWIGVMCAVSLLALSVAAPLSIIATDAALDSFLPEDWKPFSPSFDVTTAPLGAIGGAVLITLGLLGRSPRRGNGPPVAPPPPPADFTFTS